MYIGLIAAVISKNSKGMNVFRRPLARQIEYDFTVDDLISSGSTVEDAIEEANVLFNEEYDTRLLYMFRNANDIKLKQQLQDKIDTIEANGDNPVAITFALSGMMQMLSSSDSHTSNMTWKLIEAKKLPQSVVRVLRQYKVKEDEEDIVDKDSDDDEDEEENNILQILNILDFLLYVAMEGVKVPDRLYNPSELFSLDEEAIAILYQRLDEYIDNINIVEKLVDFFSVLLYQETNRALFLGLGITELLQLTGKMHKNHANLNEKITIILSSISS